MFRCLQCGFVPREAAAFCPGCGTSSNSPVAYQTQTQGQVYQPTPTAGHHMMAAKGFGQIFGILPSVAFLTFLIDTMLFGGEALSLGAILPISVGVGCVLGFITYKAQMRWYGDDRESAIIKGLILALLTAIPTALPAAIYLPSGLLGLFHGFRRK